MQNKVSLIDQADADYARSLGMICGKDAGWDQQDLWLSESGAVRVYPVTKFGEHTWVRAIFYSGTENVPFTTHEYKSFREAVRSGR